MENLIITIAGIVLLFLAICWSLWDTNRRRARAKGSQSQQPQKLDGRRTAEDPGDGFKSVINNPVGDGTVPAALIPETGRGYFVQVVGESHYQDTLRALRADSASEPNQTVILSPEPENPHDTNAVAVTTFKADTIGYLAREEAARYQPTLLELRRRGLVAICSAKFHWPRDDARNISVYLDLESPMAVAAEFGIEYKYQRKKKVDENP